MMRLMMALLIVLVPTVALAKGECKEDKKKFCKDVVEAKGDVGDCLEKHLAELSESCKAKQQTRSDNPAHENKSGDAGKAGNATDAKGPPPAPQPQ